MKKIIFLLTLITFIFLISDSCKKKCESNNLGNVSFTSTDLQITPYSGTEKLTFSDSLGDLEIFTGVGRRSDYNNTIYQYPSNNDDDCQGDYYNAESNWTIFNGKDISTYIQFVLTMGSSSPFHQNNIKYININVYEDTKNWYFESLFVFDNLQLYNVSQGSASIISFNDSLVIGPKKFYSAYVLKQITILYGSNLQYVYYTIKNGIVGFKEQTGKRWYLN